MLVMYTLFGRSFAKGRERVRTFLYCY